MLSGLQVEVPFLAQSSPGRKDFWHSGAEQMLNRVSWFLVEARMPRTRAVMLDELHQRMYR